MTNLSRYDHYIKKQDLERQIYIAELLTDCIVFIQRKIKSSVDNCVFPSIPSDNKYGWD